MPVHTAAPIVPIHNAIIMGVVGFMVAAGLVIVVLITYFGKWGQLWRVWLTSLDHKRIGIMYIVLALVMLRRGYWQVTKPGIVGGNVLAVAAGFLFASGKHADFVLLAATLAGIALVIASACVLNNLMDRDLDRLMSRTWSRALARGALQPGAALLYATVLGLAGGAVLLAHDGILPVGIVLGGFAVYVGLYTYLLKRRTGWAIEVGSLAGAAPPVAGYCAASGRLDAVAALLGLVFCLWQVPHFHAIAVYRLADYRAAAMPVFPLTQGMAAAKRQAVGCIVGFIVATQLLVAAGQFEGAVAAASHAVTAVAGLAWLYAAWRDDAFAEGSRRARRAFIGSLAALAVLVGALAAGSVFAS